MRKIFTVIVLLTMMSCLNESGSSPGVSTTFIRYYSGGNNDAAQAMEVTPEGGYIILATTRVQKTEADKVASKIKLIKTDINGNVIWQSLFPAIDDNSANYTASNLQILPEGGYVITGQDIQADGSSKSLVLTVEPANGQKDKVSSFTLFNSSSSGKAIAVNKTNNFLVLSSSGTDSMRLSEIKRSDFSVVWAKTYSAGSTNLASRLFVEEAPVASTAPQKVLWSGVVTKSGLTGIRMIKATENAENTDFDLLISKPGFSETATDFCRFGTGGAYSYAIIGSTNQKEGSTTAGSDTDILFKHLATDGTVLSTKSFPFKNDGQNDTGNSISTTTDGGLILLSSVNSPAIGGGLILPTGVTASTAAEGRGDTDYYLIRINAFGDFVWSSSFGSRFKDEGVTVRQANDGGFAILGTTTQGSLKIVTLTKTDKDGKIQ